MNQLELKIHPPIVFLLCAVLMYAISLLAPQITFKPWFRSIAPFLALLSLISGLVFPITGIQAFRKANTTISPTKPHKSATVVTTGIYRITRNPMYLGLFFLLFAFGLFLSNVLCLAATLLFILYINAFQITPEERILEENFGKDYLNYKEKVRRWL